MLTLTSGELFDAAEALEKRADEIAHLSRMSVVVTTDEIRNRWGEKVKEYRSLAKKLRELVGMCGEGIRILA